MIRKDRTSPPGFFDQKHGSVPYTKDAPCLLDTGRLLIVERLFLTVGRRGHGGACNIFCAGLLEDILGNVFTVAVGMHRDEIATF